MCENTIQTIQMKGGALRTNTMEEDFVHSIELRQVSP